MKTILSCIDHVFLGTGAYPVQFVFYYPEKLDVGRMKRALTKIDRRFWPLAGRLIKENDLYYIESDKDCRLVLEEQDCSEKLPEFNSSEQLARYALEIDLSLGSPLTRLKLFHFNQGTILSVNIAHCLVDGYSFFYFLANWAYCSRYISHNIRKISQKLFAAPKHNRKILWSDRQDYVELKKWSEHKIRNWLFEETGLAMSRDREGLSLQNSKWDIVEFTREELLGSLGNYSNPKEAALSWHDLLSAQLWKTTAEKWPVGEEYLTFTSAFDFRRVYSAVNRKYFGNAVRACGVRLKTEEVKSKPLAELAGLIRQSTKIIDENRVKNAIAAISAYWKAFQEQGSQKLHVADPDHGLLVTNLSRLPSNTLNFGTGAPIHAIPMTPAPRTAVVTSSTDGFYVRLSEPL